MSSILLRRRRSGGSTWACRHSSAGDDPLVIGKVVLVDPDFCMHVVLRDDDFAGWPNVAVDVATAAPDAEATAATTNTVK